MGGILFFKIVFWLVVATAIALYGVMVMWSLPIIANDAGGLLAFDMRPTGYVFEEARLLLSALSPETTAFYLNVQQRLDILFPFFQSLAIGWAIFRLLPHRWRGWRYGVALVALPGMVFDYLENIIVAEMLNAGAKGLTRQMVDLASYYTQMKSIFVTISMTLLLVLILLWVVARLRGSNRGGNKI